MRIEIDLPDLEELYCIDEYGITGKDIKEIIVDIAIEKFIGKIYDDYVNDNAYESIRNDAKEIVKTHSKEIVDKTVDRVAAEILRKKAIVKEIPRVSEITNINKEWEKYFVDLIDKAIARRFK